MKDFLSENPIGDNRHYIIVDGKRRITGGWSDGPLPDKDTANAILYNDKGGYQFRLEPGGEENPPLINFEDMTHKYIYVPGGNPPYRKATAEELKAERAEIEANTPPAPPALEEKFAALQAENKMLKAQVQAAADRQEFVEDCIAEMAVQVYSA